MDRRGTKRIGKSSLYGNTDIEAFDQSIWIINPDLLTLRIQQVEKLSRDEANLQAVRRIEAWLALHDALGLKPENECK